MIRAESKRLAKARVELRPKGGTLTCSCRRSAFRRRHGPSSLKLPFPLDKRFFVALTLFTLVGCVSPPTESLPLSNDQLRAFFANAKDPRRFGITVYAGPNGPIFSGSNRIHPNQRKRILFASRSNPTIKVRGPGSTEYLALLDTSSPHSWATLRTAQAMRMVPLGAPAYEQKPTRG